MAENKPARPSDNKPAPIEGKREMSFVEHLEELRWHLVRSISAIMVVMIAAFIGKRFVFDVLIFGPKNPDFPTYKALCWLSANLGLGDTLCLIPPEFTIANLRMLGEFLSHLQVSAVIGLVVAFPYVLWEVWRFIRPGLYNKEISTTRGVVAWCSLLFMLGVSFGYFVIVPFSINFLIPYSISAEVSDYIQLNDYISFVTMVVLAAGIMFELPVAIYFLAKLGLVGPEFLRKHRKHALIIILFSSAIITPPDVTSQLLIGIPVLLLYEVGIRIAARVEREHLSPKD